MNLLIANEGQQGNMPGILDCFCHCTLVLCTCSSLTAGSDFACLINVALKKFSVFIINFNAFIRTKLADF
jgi:hypothetical protein